MRSSVRGDALKIQSETPTKESLSQALSDCFLKTKIKQCVWALVLSGPNFFGKQDINTGDSLIHLNDVTF